MMERAFRTGAATRAKETGAAQTEARSPLHSAALACRGHRGAQSSSASTARARWRHIAWLALACTAVIAMPSAARGQAGAIGVHDPVVIAHGDEFVLFHTGNGIPMKRSSDLFHWTEAGRVFEERPAWIAEAVPAARGSQWAPDISFFNGRYHLYYSVSSFGSQHSAIGLATNRTLDPDSPDYRWEDHGPVIRSIPHVSTHNAIDPNLVIDGEGQPWISWGSFWGGIKMRQVDLATGMLSDRDTTLYSLAARDDPATTSGASNDQSIEAPFIIRHGEHYYLFASFDSCCRRELSTYNIRVGRADEVTGPYVDGSGIPMTAGGGTIVLSGAGNVRGPGHNAILTRGEADYLVHHYYDAADGGRSKLQIRRLIWKEDGWPVAGDPIDQP